MTPLIKRVFQYHGAEHKVINAYENELPMTVENVQAQSRLHYRCGSSFILFTVIVGMFIYFLVPTDPFWLRIVNRILLIPVVLGVSFEVLQLTNSLRNVPVLKYLGYPGLWLQLITTKEPDDKQVEVAIASFEKLLEVEIHGAEALDVVKGYGNSDRNGSCELIKTEGADKAPSVLRLFIIHISIARYSLYMYCSRPFLRLFLVYKPDMYLRLRNQL